MRESMLRKKVLYITVLVVYFPRNRNVDGSANGILRHSLPNNNLIVAWNNFTSLMNSDVVLSLQLIQIILNRSYGSEGP